MKHCLTIPTNRECAIFLQKYCEECKYAKNNMNLDIGFLIVDTNEESVSKRHKDILKKYSDDIDIYYMDNKDQMKFLEFLVSKEQEKERQKLLEILNPSRCSYGAAANKTFLYATALGADFIHRRDSDTMPQEVRGKKIYPIESENEFLGKKYCSILNCEKINSVYPEVLLCGSNYVGEWATDLKELYEYDKDIFYKYCNLGVRNNTSLKHLKEVLDKRYINEEAKKFTKDEFELTFDKLAEVGNHSILDIFKYIPIIPACDATSTDYLYHNILAKMKIPMVYHNRHVIHQHEKFRDSESSFYTYQMKIFKHRGMYIIINKFLDELAYDKLFSYQEKLTINTEYYIAQYEKVINEKYDVEINKVFDEIESIVSSVQIPKYQNVVKLFHKQREQLINDIYQDLDDYKFLLQMWSKLITNASLYKVKKLKK